MSMVESAVLRAELQPAGKEVPVQVNNLPSKFLNRQT